MEVNLNRIYLDLFKSNARYLILMGGRASGRSYSVSQFALVNLLGSDYFRAAIMRFVLGDIRNSIYQEIRDRIDENELENQIRIRENVLTFEYGQNKINGIGFRKSSADQKSKLKSLANYNCVIIEEADEVSEEDFIQLDDSIRTAKNDIKIILLLNPPHESHWIVRRWFNLINSGIAGFYRADLKKEMTDTKFIFGTYRDNIENLDKKTISNYERYKQINPDHYYNMIEGLISEGARGRVFKDWGVMTNDEFNKLPYPSYFGLDFGYSNDPCALIEIKSHNDQVWLKELIYKTGLTNRELAKRIKQLGLKEDDYIIADSAEPKSIDELKSDGLNVKPSVKGADSIRSGIDTLLSKKVLYTEQSTNLAIEVQNYCWALDRNKEPTNKPIDNYNHGLDAIRYAVSLKQKVKEPEIYFI